MKKILLVLILFLGFVLRFYRLNEFPAINADEAALGYNAYSLLETGKDEHGNPWPVHFQSFNDYKPGLYVYLILPLVKLIGLNEWSVRIPGATLGVLTIFIVYLLTKEFSKLKNAIVPNDLSLVAAFLLSISPWHIHFSRGGWEVNVATFFIITGVLFLLKAFVNNKFYPVSVIFFVLSLYTYHSARIVSPVLVSGILLFNFKNTIKDFKPIFLSFIIGCALLIPLLVDLTSGAIASRASSVGIFADQGPLSRVNEQRGEHQKFFGVESKLFHNKIVNYSLDFLDNWGKHYWGEFLFLSGDEIQRNRVPETGQLYLIELLFVVLGGILMLKNIRFWYLPLWWLLIAPVAAALTFQSPHALRSHNMIIPLTIISAYGLTKIVEIAKKHFSVLSSSSLYSFWILLLVFSLSRYLHVYWIHMAKEYPFSSQYGVKELVAFIEANKKNDRNIIVTDRYDQPYILFLFYTKFDPRKFQTNHFLTGKDQYGFSTVSQFDSYTFKSINFEEDKIEHKDSLIVGTDEQIPNEANIIKQIYGPNGYLYFEVVEN